MHNRPQDYPRPEKHPYQMEKHGDIRQDSYYWLRERENPKVIDYLKKENAYTAQVMAPAKELQEKIFHELKSRVKEDESSVPVKKNGFYYYGRFQTGQQYPLYARKKDSLNSPEELLLNGPELAKGHSFYQTTGPMMNSRQDIMAYAEDTVGRRFFTIHFKDLKTGKLLPDILENVNANLVWANDGETVFYSEQHPETLRTDKIYRYSLKTHKKELLYFEKDETFSVQVYKSLSEKFIYIGAYSTLTTEIQYLPADKPAERFKVFSPRQRGHEYAVTDGIDKFYIVSNLQAKNFRLMTADLKNTNLKNWKELIPHRPDVFLQDVAVFKNHLVMDERRNGLTQIHITDRNAKTSYLIPFADQSFMAAVGDNREYETDMLRFEYESMRLPPSIYDINMVTHQQELKKTHEVPNYNPELYKTERIFITARDGTKVPVSMVMKKDFKANGTAPLLIYGYGSYGVNMDPWFSSDVFSLVDRGFVYARAHIRGGSEMGRDWYESGRTLHKKNTFFDFIDCSEALVKEKIADPKKMYAMGGSAGGLLVGAVMNLRPDLFHGVVAQVPFVDIITTMLDDSIPLTTGEYDEWGNPNEKLYYDYIKTYSPYDNVVDAKYPNVLVTTGLHDSQVQYWEPAKWVPKLREHNQGNSVILLKTDLDSGHGGASGRFDQLKETATEYAFILMINGKK